MVQRLVLQILCLLFTSSQSVSSTANLSLSCQTRWVLLSPPTYTQTAWVRVGALYNSSWQLDSITPTRESFVRDGFKVGFSTLYFPSTCVQTLPKHLFPLSHCGPKGLGHRLLTCEDTARPGKVKRLRNTHSITGYYINQTLPPSDLPSLNSKPLLSYQYRDFLS